MRRFSASLIPLCWGLVHLPSASNHQFHGLDLGNHDNDGSGSGDDSYQGDMDEQEQGRFSSEDEVFGRFGVQETRHDS